MRDNPYSPTWFQLFMEPIPAVQTEREIQFITRNAPLRAHREVLDLCCGTGRHAERLEQAGYHVTGVDSNAAAISRARSSSAGGVTYLQQDMREIGALPGEFDVVLSLWQSFGYFDDATNREILRAVAGKLRIGGRLVLDIYHRTFFERNQGERAFDREGRRIVERRRMVADRLLVTLDYGAGSPADTFAWQLYDPEEVCDLCESVGLRLDVACTGFDERLPPSPDSPRVQYVLTLDGVPVNH